MEYRGYFIKEEDFGGFIFWPGDAQGYDAEWTGDGWRDNSNNADSLEHAKEMIDILIFEQDHTVVTKMRVHDEVVEHKTIFPWLEDALKFASQENGILMTEFTDI